MEGVEIITSPVVDVEITSSISSFVSQKRFQRDLTVAALKVGVAINLIVIRHTSKLYTGSY